MFSKQPEISLADLSIDLRDKDDWSVEALKTYDVPLDVTTLAIEPISRILAIGTSSGIIHIFGRAGVVSTINLPEPIEVRFLQFAVSTFHIVCLDCENRLHVFSLLDLGKPKFIVSARFDPINSITLSPSHTHIFLATQHGDIKTFDLTCLRKSPYSIPNLWSLYEEKMTASGVPSLLPSDQSSAHAVDVVIHPRNLELLFIAYSGGVVLTDLTERSTIRVYELILLPGAPGGAGYDSHDILTHRRPMVTSLAIHPSGHFFAAGYDDGCIAFWAVDDDNKPLLVRTLHDLDVNILDPERLDALSISDTLKKTTLSLPEPIFKLSWSSYPNSPDPRGGETTLTILGGSIPGKPFGLSVFLFPPFNPSEAPSDPPAPASSIHPFYRKAMYESLVPKKTFIYNTCGIVQDHLLLPHNIPHLSGNFDPYAILLITEVNTARTVEAYQFPPPGFLKTIQIPFSDQEVVDTNDKEHADTQKPSPPSIKSPSGVKSGPDPLMTPFCLSIGTSGVLGGQLLQLDNETYQSFTTKSSVVHPSLGLKGGQAYTETTSESKLLKYQSHRILVTRNQDTTVTFFDFSPQLLLPNNTAESLLQHDWPKALPGLTIRLHDILEDPQSSELLMATYDNVVIESVNLAAQALEVALTLKSGEVLVYRSAENSPRHPPRAMLEDTDIVLLDHILSQTGTRMSPHFMLIADKGPVAACALSDIGT
ncbi:hypothetical protein HYPSUDRAFT_197277 [Hypholoma sublateritium FD-334 SS-4]|uniref:Lethal giant larvae (Lgl)-like C-terminal domain-containing protein n=1 Tax=Hypholoma sublateritium (strain FD-334 SS-4) TaxID=945553 RepID=A0A0D2PIW9_HYPSF|nr:hypothetical protein HYPSUDRAFT_197277 [Hypholoma sublateritium FD-334 SS-4]